MGRLQTMCVLLILLIAFVDARGHGGGHGGGHHNGSGGSSRPYCKADKVLDKCRTLKANECTKDNLETFEKENKCRIAISDVEKAAVKSETSNFSIVDGKCDIEKNNVYKESNLKASNNLNKQWRESVEKQIKSAFGECSENCLDSVLDACLSNITDQDVRRQMKRDILPLDGSVPQWEKSPFQSQELLTMWLEFGEDSIKKEIKHDVDQYNENNEEWSRALSKVENVDQIFTDLIEKRGNESSLMKVNAYFQIIFCVGFGILMWFKGRVLKTFGEKIQDTPDQVAIVITAIATIGFAYVYGAIFFLVDAAQNLGNGVITISETNPVVWENYNPLGVYFVSVGNWLVFAATLVTTALIFFHGDTNEKWEESPAVRNVYSYGSAAVALIVHIGLVIRSAAVHPALSFCYIALSALTAFFSFKKMISHTNLLRLKN